MQKDELIKRYYSQILLDELSIEKQELLSKKSITVIGCGGLGCPLAAYLAGAGVGKIKLVDDDTVELRNLHRQVFFSENDIGIKKVKALSDLANEINQPSNWADLDVMKRLKQDQDDYAKEDALFDKARKKAGLDSTDDDDTAQLEEMRRRYKASQKQTDEDDTGIVEPSSEEGQSDTGQFPEEECGCRQKNSNYGVSLLPLFMWLGYRRRKS